MMYIKRDISVYNRYQFELLNAFNLRKTRYLLSFEYINIKFNV